MGCSGRQLVAPPDGAGCGAGLSRRVLQFAGGDGGSILHVLQVVDPVPVPSRGGWHWRFDLAERDEGSRGGAEQADGRRALNDGRSSGATGIRGEWATGRSKW